MHHTLPIQVDKGTGDTIVLLHGLGNNYKSWTYVLDNFDYEKNQIIAVDLLGFGDAAKPKDSEYTVSDHAKAVIATLDEMNLTKAIIAGHSMGCLVAVEIARQRPALVKNMILLGAPLFRHMPSKYAKFQFWKKEDVYSKLFRILSNEKDLTLVAARGVNTFLPLVQGMEVTDDTWPAFKRSLLHTVMQTKTFEDLTSITIPTQLIYCRLDIFVIKKNLRKAARRNKRFITYKTALGPHEIIPLHGKTIARLLQGIED